jgi:hypothetical protein
MECIFNSPLQLIFDASKSFSISAKRENHEYTLLRSQVGTCGHLREIMAKLTGTVYFTTFRWKAPKTNRPRTVTELYKMRETICQYYPLRLQPQPMFRIQLTTARSRRRKISSAEATVNQSSIKKVKGIPVPGCEGP